MAGRRLRADEAALWSRVAATVKPISKRASAALPPLQPPSPTQRTPVPAEPGAFAPKPKASKSSANTLDGGWDRRLAQGRASPDVTLDLHGYTLAAAHIRLESGLEDAVRSGARVMLLITGKPPAPQRDGQASPRRGLIRASVADWLASSRYHIDIAAIRNAHPRHGGQGALYIIFRRARMPF
jgi:DNA-nicking Smr family endonuclease